jgi:hypothetical protein
LCFFLKDWFDLLSRLPAISGASAAPPINCLQRLPSCYLTALCPNRFF